MKYLGSILWHLKTHFFKYYIVNPIINFNYFFQWGGSFLPGVPARKSINQFISQVIVSIKFIRNLRRKSGGLGEMKMKGGKI